MDGWVGGWDQEPAGWQEWPLPDFFFSIPPPPTDPCPHVWGKRTETSMIRRGVVVVVVWVHRYPVLGHSLWCPLSTVRRRRELAEEQTMPRTGQPLRPF